MIGSEKWYPPWLLATADDRATHPHFTWRHGSVIERSLLEGEASGEYDAGEVPFWQVSTAFAEGLNTLLPGDEQVPQLIELADRDLRGDRLDAIDAALLKAAQAELRASWPAYGALAARQGRRDAIVPTLAFRRFVTGWANIVDAAGESVPYARGADGNIADSALLRVEPLFIHTLGLTIYRSLYARGLEKNFAPRSKSGSARGTSKPVRRSRAGGRSAKTPGPKTPS